MMGWSQCDYTLEMNDSFGDGWNGFSLDVSVNGTAVLTGSTFTAGGQALATFTVNDGDDVTTSVNTTGSFDSEVSYRILNSVVDSADSVDDCDNSQFSVDIVVSDAGDAGSVFDDGTTTYPVAVGTVTVGPYAVGDSVTIELTAVDPECSTTIGTFISGCPPSNDECAGAIAIACDGQYVGDTTAASPEVDDPGTCGTSAGTAGTVWYTFVGANSNDAGAAAGSVGDDVTLDLSASTFDTKIRVFTGVCGDLTCVDGDDDGGAGTTSLLTIPGTTVGTTYYVLVHGFSGNAGAYTLDVSCTPPPLCGAAVFDAGMINDSGCNADGTGTFSVDIEVTNAGDAGGMFNDGTNMYPVVAGTVTAGPYNTGDSVTIEYVNGDPACDSTVGTFTFDCPLPPPANDEAAGAIDLPVGDTMCDDAVLATNVSATTSVENVNTADCTFAGGAPAGDVWYKVTVPATGEVTVETSTSGEVTDTVMTIYRGASGSLVELGCSDDEGTGAFSIIALTSADGISPGDVLLVRVWEYADDNKGTFNICAWSPSTLGIDDNSLAQFSYYPNPVNNTLTLNAQNTIEDVTLYNMLGQVVLRATPNAVNTDVDMSALSNGAYFVQVTIANITKTVRVIKQ